MGRRQELGNDDLQDILDDKLTHSTFALSEKPAINHSKVRCLQSLGKIKKRENGFSKNFQRKICWLDSHHSHGISSFLAKHEKKNLNLYSK